MSRPCCRRRIEFEAGVKYFKPAGIPACDLEEISIALDEMEAMRLADLEGLYQEQAAQKMGVSRATFGRIVEQARKKVVFALIYGKAIRLAGGNIAPKGDSPMKGSHSGSPFETKMGKGLGRGPCGCGQRHRRGARQCSSGPGRLDSPEMQERKTAKENPSPNENIEERG